MSISPKVRAEFRRALRNNRYEKTPEGIYLNDTKLMIGGAMVTSLLRGPSFEERGHDTQVHENLVVNQGLILALINVLAAGVQVTQWFLMPYKNNATPQATWTGQSVASDAGEFTNYDEATRPLFVFPDPTTITTPSINNGASLAVTTIGAGADKTLWGGTVVSNSVKGGNNAGDKCFAAVKFAAARSGLQTGDAIGWQYQLTGVGS